MITKPSVTNCKNCNRMIQYKPTSKEYCSVKCKETIVHHPGSHPIYESDEREHNMWRTYWRCRNQGHVPLKDNTTYNLIDTLFKTERFYQK